MMMVLGLIRESRPESHALATKHVGSAESAVCAPHVDHQARLPLSVV